jgi:hypothetical protein
MADSAVCAWCGKEAVTEVVVRPGRSQRKTAPVCEAHAEDFERRGMTTVRVEASNKIMSEVKRNEWLRRYRWMQ